MRAPWELTRDMFLSQAEAARLLAHVRIEQRAAASAKAADRARIDRLLIEVLLFSGLRCSELCKLRAADSPAHLTQPVVKVVGRAGEGRTVWLPEDVAVQIRRYARDLRPRLLPAGHSPKSPKLPLIYHERLRPFERSGLYRRIVAILSRVGLESRASVQLLRHTYGYLAYLGTGGNLLFVQRQLGHAHPMITSIYAQFVDESYAKLAGAMQAAVSAEKEGTAASQARAHRPSTARA